ncbi:hypothetical protein OUZ56_000770 [Daphnia magna]|uniref:Uncharacterized protein n=1 Tax=Daphnia magna TaxID=35525 RepID=A0ABR0A0Q4_9CRUS|nr:hypothetical protein OUZ56_000770 [Daphnia magna]
MSLIHYSESSTTFLPLCKSLDVTGSNEPFPFTHTYIGDFFHASWLLRCLCWPPDGEKRDPCQGKWR